MGNDHDRSACVFNFFEAFKAFFLKAHIPDSQYLINQKYVGSYIDRNGKSQPHIHSGGISPHRVVNIFIQLRKCNNIINLLINLLFGHSKNRSIGIDIFPAGHIRMKACSKLQQTGNSSVDLHLSIRGIHDLVDQLQGGTLATAVSADQSYRFPLLNGKADIIQHPVILIPIALPEQHFVLHAVAFICINLELLFYIHQLD